MGFTSRRIATPAVAGDLDTNANGTQEGVSFVNMNQVEPGSLSAKAAIDCETSTLTVYVDWQVSLDNSTWVDCANGSQNAAGVVVATGTGGADATVTKVYPAPSAAYAFPYARIAIRNGVTTGAAVDTYSVTYHYMKPEFR